VKRRRKVGSKSSKADQLAKGNSSGGSHTLTTNLVSYEKKYLLKTTSNKSNILWADPRELVPFTNNVWKALDYDRKKKYHKAMKRWFTSTGIDPQGSGRRLNVVRTEPTRNIQKSWHWEAFGCPPHRQKRRIYGGWQPHGTHRPKPRSTSISNPSRVLGGYIRLLCTHQKSCSFEGPRP